MVMKIGFVGNMLATMYTDLATIYRHTTTLNADGTTSITLTETAVESDIPCRISFTRADSPETSENDSNPIYLETKIFCGAGVDIRKGDKVVAQRIDENGNAVATYTGIANLPFTYITHQEVLLVEVGEA